MRVTLYCLYPQFFSVLLTSHCGSEHTVIILYGAFQIENGRILMILLILIGIKHFV
jgi:hypothetical protein